MQSLLGITRRPDVIFRHNGHFDITAPVAKALHLAAGDSVDLLTDGTEYYLTVAHHASPSAFGRFRAQVRPTSTRLRHHFRGSSVLLCRAIIAATSPGATRLALPCGLPTSHPDFPHRILIPIITHLNITNK